MWNNANINANRNEKSARRRRKHGALTDCKGGAKNFVLLLLLVRHPDPLKNFFKICRQLLELSAKCAEFPLSQNGKSTSKNPRSGSRSRWLPKFNGDFLKFSLSKDTSLVKFSWRSDNSTSACYSCIARCCYGNSVRLSVRHMLILYRNECTYRQILSTIW